MNGKQVKRLRRQLNVAIGQALAVLAQRVQDPEDAMTEAEGRLHVQKLVIGRKRIFRRMKRTYVRSTH